ncbi:MAG: hypothetical protein CMP22_02175 [Rickettsiales bacterium]|nr:hypothetical protein [Rickettsiales bacterium]
MKNPQHLALLHANNSITTSQDGSEYTISSAYNKSMPDTMMAAIITSNFEVLTDEDVTLGCELIKTKQVFKKSLQNEFDRLRDQNQRKGFNLYSFCGIIWVGLEEKARRDVQAEIDVDFHWKSGAHKQAFKQAFLERKDNFLESFIFNPEGQFGDEIARIFDDIDCKLGQDALLEIQFNDRRRFLKHCQL